MRTYVNTFSNVTTKVLTYSHLQSLTQGFGLGPLIERFSGACRKTKETSPVELVSLCVPLSNCRTVFRAMQEVYEFSLWLEVYD